MLQLARRQADRLGRQVDLRLDDAQALELPDASFDTVVCTFSLCAIPDERRAIAEMRWVLRPGGRLLLLDHVAGTSRWVRAVQWLLERVTTPLNEEHLLRRPLLQVQAEGFQIERAKRSKLGIVERLAPASRPNRPHLLGGLDPYGREQGEQSLEPQFRTHHRLRRDERRPDPPPGTRPAVSSKYRDATPHVRWRALDAPCPSQSMAPSTRSGPARRSRR
jgi:SAM-dependent methyltransferase